MPPFKSDHNHNQGCNKDHRSNSPHIQNVQVIVPSSLNDFKPTTHRKSSSKELALLKFACGRRNCTDSVTDRAINYYIVPIGGVITFIILSLKPVDNCLAEIIPSYLQRLIFKIVIIFVVLYLLDRWIDSWRSNVTICEK